MNKFLNVSLILNIILFIGFCCAYEDSKISQERNQRYGKYIDELDLKIKNLQNDLYFKK